MHDMVTDVSAELVPVYVVDRIRIKLLCTFKLTNASWVRP